MKIITISGVDGSGKSTQLELLRKNLEEKGSTVYLFHSVSFSLVNSLIRKKKKKIGDQVRNASNITSNQSTIFEQEPRKAVTSGNFLTIFARKLVLLIDLYRFKRLTKRLEKERVDYLLSDRYFYDQIINILYLSYKKRILNSLLTKKGKKVDVRLCPLLKLANKLVKKPELAFFIDVPSSLILKRDREIEQGRNYLVIKRALYKKFASLWGIKLIDGRNSIEVIQKQILKEIY